jgi:hypothetical protein
MIEDAIFREIPFITHEHFYNAYLNNLYTEQTIKDSLDASNENLCITVIKPN